MTREPRFRRADSSTGGAAVLDPIDDLTMSIAPLVANVDLRHSTLVGLDPEQRRLVGKTFEHLGKLHDRTAWPADQLLRRLGCQLTPEHLEAPDSARFTRCERFLGLVVRLVDLVDTTSDRRLVIMECVDLLADQRQGTAALETAFFGGPSLTASDFVSLGEVVSGALVARKRAGLCTEDAPKGRLASHLSPRRIDMMLLGDVGDVGPMVLKRMQDHVATCSGCTRAVNARKLLLGS